jgi:hypothetical protein
MMSRNKIFSRKLLCGAAVILLTLILWSIDYTNPGWGLENSWFLWLFAVPVAGIFYYSFQDRCPHCGELLFRLPLYAKCCPYCGKEI